MAEDTHKTKIVISGDATSAVSALDKARKTIGAISKIKWFASGVEMIITAFKTLHGAPPGIL